MKKILLIGVFAFIAQLGFGQITGSKHDFQAWANNSNGDGEICLPCHTPHNALNNTAPLWNHIPTIQVFTPYPSGGTMQSTPLVPSGVSLLCLSCHDGITNMDGFGGAAGTAPMAAGPATFGLDLSLHHPISLTYDAALGDAEIYDPTLTASGLGANIDDDMLFGAGNDQLECASCHDVHNTTVGPVMLLRKDNAASALCLTCHDK